MSKIVLNNINKFYGSNHVLKDINLTINDGEFMTLLGPSGCGKTTTLRVIAGLEEPKSGQIYMDDKLIANGEEDFFTPSSERNLNLVFQSYALWPHMTVYQIVAFGLQIKKMPKNQIDEIVKNALKRMQIEEYADRYPSELSGGQQQRVAIARAIATNPKVLLLDEPLSNLDAKLRVDMRGELKRLHQEMGTTIVYVTHDQVEALTMSTRVAIFFEGEIEQVDTPMNVYNNPATVKVANFIGNPRINTISGTVKKQDSKYLIDSCLGHIEIPESDVEGELTDKCVIAFRPEQVLLSKKDNGKASAKVYSCMPAGSETLVSLEANNEQFLVKELGVNEYEHNSTVYLSIDSNRLNIYNFETGKLVVKAQM